MGKSKHSSSKSKIIIFIFAFIVLSMIILVALALMEDGPIDDYISSNQQMITSDKKLSDGRKIYNLNQELEEENNTGANAETTSTQSTNSPNGVVTNEEYKKLSSVEKYNYIKNLLEQTCGGWDLDDVKKAVGAKKLLNANYVWKQFQYCVPAAIVEYFEYDIIASIPMEQSLTEAGWPFDPKQAKDLSKKYYNYLGQTWSSGLAKSNPHVTEDHVMLSGDMGYGIGVKKVAWCKWNHCVDSFLTWGYQWRNNKTFKKYHLENYTSWQDYGTVSWKSGYGGYEGYQSDHEKMMKWYEPSKIDALAETIKDQMNRQSASSSGNTSNNNYVTLGGTVIDSTKEWTPYSITEEWGYPLDPSKGTYTSGAGMRLHPKLGYVRLHSGIDYSCPKGTDVYATKSGKVIQACYQGERGNQVLIDHGNGWYTRYQHMSKLSVKQGQSVTQGTKVGESGNTGKTSSGQLISIGYHLHYEMLYGGYAQSNYKNPTNYYNMKKGGRMKLKDGTTFKDYMQCIKDYGAYGKVNKSTANSNSGGVTATKTGTNTNSNTSLAADYSSAIKQMRSLSGSGSNTDPRVSISTPGYSWIQTYDVNLSNVSDERLAVLAEGSKYLGTPYQNPKPNTPSEFCCSHFTSWCYRKALGYTTSEVPTYSGSQKNLSVAKEITLNEAKPGDLIWKPGHVMLFVKKINDNRIVVMESTSKNYCKGKGTTVSSRPVDSSYKYFKLDKFKD